VRDQTLYAPLGGLFDRQEPKPLPSAALIEAWADGACEPVNPGGHAAYGALVKVNGETVFSEGVYVCGGPMASNNVAEYAGMLAVLRWIDKYAGQAATKIIIRGDSKLVINQLSGKWNTNCTNCGKPLKRCFCGKKTPGLYYPYYEQCRDLFAVVSRRHKITLTWIPREQNDVCDVLSKGVLKERGVEFKIQPEVVSA
jgi:ribonuclease HI